MHLSPSFKIAIGIALALALPVGIARADPKADLCMILANVAEAAYLAHASGAPVSDVDAKVSTMISKEQFAPDKHRNIERMLHAQIRMEYALPAVSEVGARETHKRIHTVTYLECMHK